MGQRGKTGLVAAGLLTATLTVSAAGVAGAAAGAGASRVEVERIDTLRTRATPGSPAHFRLVEEGDRLRVTELADELDYLERMFRQASRGSPAQFRAHEEADSLRDQLRKLNPTGEEAR